MQYLIRNDDVAYDTDLMELKWFCELCDRYGHKIVQCITSLGICIPIHVSMSDHKIVELGGKISIFHNRPLIEYLRARSDIIAVHGLWHTHIPDITDIHCAKALLAEVTLWPRMFVPPFNEGSYPDPIEGLKLFQHMRNLEEWLGKDGVPPGPNAYCHSWRFGRQCRKDDLEPLLKRMQEA